MSPARSSTFRCRGIAGRLMSNGAASSSTVASPVARRATIARRVGSASAAKIESRFAADIRLFGALVARVRSRGTVEHAGNAILRYAIREVLEQSSPAAEQNRRQRDLELLD